MDHGPVAVGLLVQWFDDVAKRGECMDFGTVSVILCPWHASARAQSLKSGFTVLSEQNEVKEYEHAPEGERESEPDQNIFSKYLCPI
jgi:hypothetical protein